MPFVIPALEGKQQAESNDNRRNDERREKGRSQRCLSWKIAPGKTDSRRSSDRDGQNRGEYRQDEAGAQAGKDIRLGDQPFEPVKRQGRRRHRAEVGPGVESHDACYHQRDGEERQSKADDTVGKGSGDPVSGSRCKRPYAHRETFQACANVMTATTAKAAASMTSEIAAPLG